MEKWILAIASNIKQSWKAKHLLRGHPAWSIADKLPVLSKDWSDASWNVFGVTQKYETAFFCSCFFLSSAPARGRSKRRTSFPLRVSFLKTSQQRIIGRHASRSIFIFARSSRRKGSGSVREPSCLTQSFNWSSFSAGPSEGSTWSVVSHKTRTCHGCVSCSYKFMLIWILQTPWHWFVYIESTWILGQAAFRKGVPKSAMLDNYEFSLFWFLLFLPLFIWSNFTRNLALKDWKTGLAWLRSKSTRVKFVRHKPGALTEFEWLIPGRSSLKFETL